MEILNNLWNVLVTEDENLTKYITLFSSILETFVTLKLFSSILDIKYTKKQMLNYFIVMFIYAFFSGFIIPPNISIFVSIFFIPITIKLIFKTSIVKSILSEIIPIIITLIIESIYLKLIQMLFGLTPIQCKHIILYRVPIILFIYGTMYLLSLFVLTIKQNISLFEKIDNYRKKLLIINLIFILICIASQFYLFIFYNNTLPLYITLISLLSLIIYSIISIYSIIKTVNLDITKVDLEQSKLHNKTLEVLYGNISAFKHDFSNIITALGGFVYTKDIIGLEKYYNKLLEECNINNNLSTLNPKIINNPAIYNILATKYYIADELGIKINLQVFINLNDLKIDIYKFSRIFSILLDNAIEAASKCEEKQILIDIHDYKSNHCQIITIQNTYSDKNIDIGKLFTKGYTSKSSDKESHGIGLWQVSKMIKKFNNVILDTSKDEKFFKQEIAIYY